MKPPGPVGAIATLAVTLALADGASGRGAEAASHTGSRRPNVLLITVESLRPDRLGCYTGGRAITPSIDALAARGVRLDRAYAASPSTAPSVATILTGLYPVHHRLRHDLMAWLREDVPTLATILRSAGYRTGAVLGSFHLDSDRGLGRGFDLYDDKIPGIRKMLAGRSKERRAEEVVGQGLAFVDAVPGDRPFFLWLDFYDPHYDYDPPEPFKTTFDKQPYDGEVAYLDAQIGRLQHGLGERGVALETEIILAGSHGEGLGDHGETGHGIYLYETTVRVPLLYVPAGSIQAPPDTEGKSSRAPVGLVDLMPTLLQRLGLAVPPGLDGRSFAPLLEGKPRTASRKYFIEAVQPHEAYGWSALFAVLDGDHKVMVGQRSESFDLGVDPDEARPIQPAPPWAAALQAFGRPLLGSLEPPAGLRLKIRDRAEALALPWKDSPICAEKTTWPDPRDRVALNDPLFRARIASDQGFIGEAIRLSQLEILPADPSNLAALEVLAVAALKRGDQATLKENLELLQCDYPFRALSYHYWAHDLESRKELDKAGKTLELFALIEPLSEEPYYDLAGLYAAQGKKEMALEYLKKSIDRGATDFGYIRKDPQFASIRDEPRFVSLVGAEPAATPAPDRPAGAAGPPAREPGRPPQPDSSP